MRVAHVGFLDFSAPTGASAAVSGLIHATPQIAHVAFSLGETPTPARATVGSAGTKELLLSPGRVMRDHGIDLIHAHGAFVPHLRAIARRSGLPYVVTPHGGYMDEVFGSSRRLSKKLFFRLWDREYLRGAAAVTGLTSNETQRLAYLSGREVCRLPNAIDLASAERISARRNGATGGGPVVFLGRGAVRCKGIDRLPSVAAAVPELQFIAHLSGQDKDPNALAFVTSNAPPNFHVSPPIYGDGKTEVLASARAYIQLGRWEAFGMSITEAAAAGIPLIVSDEMALSDDIRTAGAGVVVDATDPDCTALIRAFLQDDAALKDAGARAREWATVAFSPTTIGATAYAIYREVLAA